jgi:cell division protein FtsB
MIVQRKPWRKALPFFGYALAMGATGYFAWSAWHGERGLMARQHYEAQIAQREATIETLKAERAGWEKRVSMLQPEHIDRDLLEERARATLNSGHPNEVIVLFDEPVPPSGKTPQN